MTRRYFAVVNPYMEYVSTVIYLDDDAVLPGVNHVQIDSDDPSLVGKWYNKDDGQFYDKPSGYLHRVKMVDGADSGLDADMLDGKHASEFVLASEFQALKSKLDQLEAQLKQ